MLCGLVCVEVIFLRVKKGSFTLSRGKYIHPILALRYARVVFALCFRPFALCLASMTWNGVVWCGIQLVIYIYIRVKVRAQRVEGLEGEIVKGFQGLKGLRMGILCKSFL